MKKLILFIFTLFILFSKINGATYYLSPTGVDSPAGGTLTAPWKSWNYAFNRLIAGDILYVYGGTYNVMGSSAIGVNMSARNGTITNPITITNITGQIPVLDCSSISTSGTTTNFGILMSNCRFVNITGLTVANVPEPIGNAGPGKGWELSGCYDVKLIQCTVRGCGQGYALGGYNDNIYFTNCDSYENADHYQGGDLCNGFNVHTGVAAHIYFDGCRAWKNSDDGYDCYGGEGYIYFNNCWAFENGPWKGGDEAGNGAGFKLGKAFGPVESGVQRKVTNCLSFNNKMFGFDEGDDGNIGIIYHIYNNVSYHNQSGSGAAVAFAFWRTSGVDIIRNNISYADDNIEQNGWGNNILSNNSWQVGDAITDADFESVDLTGVKGSRNADGSLPHLSFLRVKSTSHLYHAGYYLTELVNDADNKPWNNPPTLGAYEYISSITIPIVTTTTIANIMTSNANGGGNVTSAGGGTITSRGICWALSANPTIANSKTIDGTGTGIFTSSLNSLTQGTLYHVRAYATNSAGTAYGVDVQFTTTSSSGKIQLTIEGQTYINTITGVWNGVEIPRTSPTDFIFRNNSITSVNSQNYMLLAGDELPLSTNNMLDGEIITGNKLTWNGSGTSGLEGMQIGYNKNQIVKYNYFDKPYYAIVYKAGTSTGTSMISTSGGFAYNIIKNSTIGLRIKGMSGINIYNNTLYDDIHTNVAGMINITANTDQPVAAAALGTKIKNNIFYMKYPIRAISIATVCVSSSFECDYNIYYCATGDPTFEIGSTQYNFTQWQAMGYDKHSIIINPNFINTTSLVPTVRLDYGTNLGADWQTGLSTTSNWIVGSAPAIMNQNGVWQVGSYVFNSTSHSTLGKLIKSQGRLLIKK